MAYNVLGIPICGYEMNEEVKAHDPEHYNLSLNIEGYFTPTEGNFYPMFM